MRNCLTSVHSMPENYLTVKKSIAFNDILIIIIKNKHILELFCLKKCTDL
jgi:hypothetical protein